MDQHDVLLEPKIVFKWTIGLISYRIWYIHAQIKQQKNNDETRAKNATQHRQAGVI